MSRTNKPTNPPASKPTSWKDRLAAEDWEELKNTFDVFDEDHSGTIDPAEISKVLEELGLDKRNPFILSLIHGLQEKNKPVSWEEFVDIIASRVGETKTKDGLKRVFALFDTEGSGQIGFEQLKAISKQLKDGINDDDLLEMMHSTHINKKTASNESFSFDEFYQVVSKFANK
jgi:Ca2+-binding EF-hand superfamily protein